MAVSVVCMPAYAAENQGEDVSVETFSGEEATGNNLYDILGHYNDPYVTITEVKNVQVGTEVKTTVKYESNGVVDFRFSVYDAEAKDWKIIGDWNVYEEILWSPGNSGTYTIKVEARTSDNKIAEKTMEYTQQPIYGRLGEVKVKPNEVGYALNVAYDTNDPTPFFRWLCYDIANNQWITISDWSRESSTTWQPEHKGDYLIYVEMDVINCDIVSKHVGTTVEGAKITGFTTSVASPSWVDKVITLKGSYANPLGEVKNIKYLVYDGSTWAEIPNDGKDGNWVPKKVGQYILVFQLLDKNNQVIAQKDMGFAIENPYVNLNGIGIAKTGDLTHKLSLSASTNDKEIQYKWMYYDVANQTWHTIKDWSNSTSVQWTAPRTGNFWIYVEAKLHDGTIKSRTEGYTVQRLTADQAAMLGKANMYSSSTPYIILVNRGTRKVGIYQGWQGNWTPVMYWDCTVGAPRSQTVTGVFRTGAKGYYFDSHGSRCFWYTQFYGDYLFHSVLYWPSNHSLKDGRLGIAASLGCVRLHINNAKWIYDNIPTGTTVVVYN